MTLVPKVGEEAGGHLGGMVEEAGGQLAGQLYINQNKHAPDDESGSHITERFCVCMSSNSCRFRF